MPSAQDCAERLREQAYKTLVPQIRDLEEELQKINSSLSAGIHQLGRKLEALHHTELPTTELILSEILEGVIRQKDREASTLALFGRSLRNQETQEEILTFLLDGARKYFPKVALFAVRGDRFVGWSSRGYSEPTARAISSCSFLRSEYPQFQEAFESEIPVTATDLPNKDGLAFLQEGAHESWQLVPLCAMQRPVALLLAGGAEEIATGRDAIAILAEFTALRLENIALKILYELSAARPEAVPKPAPEPPPPVVTAPPEPLAAPEPPAPPPAVEPPAIEPVQAVEPQVYSEPEVKFEPEPVQEMEPPSEVVSMEPEVVPVEVEEEEKELTVVAVDQAEIPVPVAQPEAAPVQSQGVPPIPEEEKLHMDAKRFARLLVSEIKLYNEHHVVEGRENQDLYLRLKRDIDRSREMYEKRISPIVSRKIDYFHDEILRILGDNDPSTLGSDYPGPRVEG